MTAEKLSPDEQLAEDLSRFYADPLGYVMYCFPWDTEASIQVVPLVEPYKSRFNSEYGPDVWACEFLDQLGEEIKNRQFDGKTPVPPIRFSTVSGHGIGKSTLTAWLIKFILDTRPFSRGTVTAMTVPQLKTKTWAALGMWHNLALTKHWFKYNSSRSDLSLSHRAHKESWRCDGMTSKEENSEAFAGQHAATSTSFYIFDEASGVPDKIFEVRDGGLTDGEPMSFDFGNPTKNTGRLFEQHEGRLRHRYICRAIDSRTVTLMSDDEVHKEWIEDYGLESDLVKVRILGQFPSMGDLQFISRDVVDEAMKREVKQDSDAALLIGVDVAGFGDDESVVYPRLGYDARSFPPERYRGLNSIQLTGKIVAMIHRFEALGKAVAMVFIDTTGGLGRGPYDNIGALGYPVMAVEFGSGPTDAKTYRYKSDELWGNMRDALPSLALPAYDTPVGPDLQVQLTQRQFGYTLNGHKIHLEPKRDMKSRLGSIASSPDIADALACTFAEKVASKVLGMELQGSAKQVVHEYDPFDQAAFDGPKKPVAPLPGNGRYG